MAKLSVLITGLLIGALGAVTSYGHHSFTATYDLTAKETIQGRIITFQFRNPHSWVQVEVKSESGEVRRYGVEWGGAAALAGQGVSRDSFRPGDQVIIVGSPGRNPADRRLHMTSIVRPTDGFGWGFKGETFQ